MTKESGFFRVCEWWYFSRPAVSLSNIAIIDVYKRQVYQQLALRLIKAVAGFDPQKGTLQQHIFAQLKYELFNCKSAYRICGLTGAPKDYRRDDMVSLDALSENCPLYERAMAA